MTTVNPGGFGPADSADSTDDPAAPRAGQERTAYAGTRPSPAPGRSPFTALRRLRGPVAAEWTKVWSLRSTWWCLLATVALQVLSSFVFGLAYVSNMNDTAAPAMAAAQAAESGVQLAQFGLIAWAMLTITGEYASGAIRGTLAAVPGRGRVLAAKALVVAPIAVVTGVISGALATAAVTPVVGLPEFGAVVDLAPGQLALDLVQVGGYLGAVSLLALGLGTALRSSAGALTAVFLLLFAVPILLSASGAQVLVDFAMRMPMFAGIAFMASVDNITGAPLDYGSGEGALWLLAWTTASLLAGYLVLRTRDA